MIEARKARREAGAEQGEAYSEARFGPRGRIAERLREATPEQREAFLAAHPRIRAMLEARRARREALAPEPR
jgi:hypothetical protein